MRRPSHVPHTNQYGPFNHDQGRHCPKCPLQTLHCYNISTHKIGPKQSTISSLTQRLLRGGQGMPRSAGHSWSCPEEKGHLSLRDDLGRQRQCPTTITRFIVFTYLTFNINYHYIRAPTFSSHLDESRKVTNLCLLLSSEHNDICNER